MASADSKTGVTFSCGVSAIESSQLDRSIDILAAHSKRAFPPQTWEPEPDLVNEAAPIPPEFFDSALEGIAPSESPDEIGFHR